MCIFYFLIIKNQINYNNLKFSSCLNPKYLLVISIFEWLKSSVINTKVNSPLYF